MNDREKYIEDLARELYWTAEQWFRRIDPYHAWSALWKHLSEERKATYREMAEKLIERDTKGEAA